MFKDKKLFLVLILPVIFLVYSLITIKDYGINWDEPYHYRRGQSFLQYFLTGQKNYNNIPKHPPLQGDSDNPTFRNAQEKLEEVQNNPSLSNPTFRRSFYQDDSWNGEYFIDLENSYGHPALNDVLAAISNKIFFQKLGIMGDLESYHFFIIMTVSLATFFIALFMWKEFGIVESVVTTLAFASYPLLLGEQHFNIKDPVETSFYTITVLAAYLGLKKNKFRWLLTAIIFFSLALSTKFNVLFSVIPLGLWFLYFLHKKGKSIDKNRMTKNLILVILLTPVIALGILFLSYPTLWKNPLSGFEQIVKFYLEVGYPGTPIQGYSHLGFFNSYPLTWIFYTTPPILIALFISSVIFFKKLLKSSGFILLLFTWLAVIVGRNSLFGALSYGGVRIIMEYITPLALIAGITAGYFVKINHTKIFLVLSTVIILAGFVPTLVKLIRIHPNENVYFNFLIGGLAGAKNKDIPYWGDSYGNAYFPGILWLNTHAEMDAKVSTPVGNTSNIPRFKLRPDIAVSPYYWSGLKHSGEYLIELTYNYDPMNYFALKYLNEAMIPVYEVKVDGVAIAKVWKNDLNHVKSEFKNTQNIFVSPQTNKTAQTLELDLHEVKKIMKVQITQPITDCTPLKTGYVATSADGKIWTREPEDIAVDQQNREEIKTLTPIYEYLFVARNARFITFNVDGQNTCLLKATQAVVTVLTP